METTEKLISQKTGNTFSFEAQHCGRCGGSGHYSYCQSHGTRCFGCGGHGIKLTKRGAAAQQYFNALLSKRADELQPGDKIRDDGIPGFTSPGWRAVISVVPSEQQFRKNADEDWQVGKDHGLVDIDCEGLGLCGIPADRVIRVAATKEQKHAAKEQALAYQATLTKQGQPRKR